ncbi:MAG: hypothetical protein VCA36_07840 [Opitutales bacterium]
MSVPVMLMNVEWFETMAFLAESYLEKESHIPGVTFGTLLLFLFLFNRMNQQK